MFNLKDPSLLKTANYVDGAWLKSTQQYNVKDPANGDVIAQCEDAGKEETIAAISHVLNSG